MRRLLLTLPAAACLTAAGSLFGQQDPPPPIVRPPAQMASAARIDRPLSLSDAVILGRVVAFEDADSEAEGIAGGPRSRVRVAVVRIDERFKGSAGLTHLRVACRQSAFQVVPDGEQPFLRRSVVTGNALAVALSVGQEGLFFLKATDSPDLLALVPSSPTPGKDQATHAGDLAGLRHIIALSADPLKVLAQGDDLERYTSLYRLLLLYRTLPVGGVAAPIGRASPEVSKRVLTMLAELSPTEHDAKRSPVAFASYALMLRLSPADGFEVPLENGVPVSGVKRYEAMHAWIKKNADTYCLRKPGP